MYNIKELAKKLKISESLVYRKLKADDIQKFIFKKDNKTFVSKEIIEFLNRKKQDFKTIQKDTTKEDSANTSNANESSMLKITNELLIEQLKIKDEEIKEKNEQINKLLKLNENAQVLMKEQQNKAIMIEEEQSKSWWQKIFK